MRDLAFRTPYFALGLTLALGCASESDTVEVAGGQALFEAACAQCHGPRGLGDGPMVPSLPTKPANLTEHLGHHTQAQLVQLIQGGIPPAMPPQPLTELQVR
jgi:mono/diheme cytochrome c family protein